MSYLIVIIGLPASGKSYLLNKFARHFTNPTIFDDYSKHHSTTIELKAAIKRGDDILISDPLFCISQNLDTLLDLFPETYSCDIRNFENNPEQCLINAKIRNQNGANKEVEGLIKLLSKNYNPTHELEPVFNGVIE